MSGRYTDFLKCLRVVDIHISWQHGCRWCILRLLDSANM